MRKSMVAFDEKVFRELDKDAKSRNISLKAFLGAVVIPDGSGTETEQERTL